MINLHKSAVRMVNVFMIGVLLIPIFTPVLQAQGFESTRNERGVKLDLSKTGLLTDVQVESLLDRVQTARKDQDARKAKSMMQKYKTDRRAAKEAAKDQLKDKNLSQKDKKTLKDSLKRNLSDLKAINAELKSDLDKELKKQFTSQELAMIKQVEPNFVYELQAFNPNDPEFNQQWGLQSIGVSGIPMSETPGTEPIIVAVIDGGVDFSHADLVASKWTSTDCVDDENNPIPGGCLDGGFDTVDEDTNPAPTDGITHGTSVASVIAAETDNSLGMASVGQNDVQIMSIRACCTAEGFFTVQDIDEAIRFAVNNGADLINASFGGPTWSQQLQDTIQYALDNGVMVVTAAGNYGSNNDTDAMWPANFNQTHPNVLSVGSIASWDHLAYFSNYGLQTVDIAAPGQSVVVAAPNSNYQTLSGTSFSAPLTTGVLAQMMRASDLDFLNTKNLLLASVETLNPLQGVINGAKVLRFTVVEDQVDPDPEPVDPDPVDPDPSDPDPTPEEPDPEPDPQSNPQCGNGILEEPEGEQCDDGNLSNGDGCSAICTIESSGNGGGGSVFVSSSTSGDLIFHHEDHLTGSSVDTDDTGAVVQLYDYYPFGDVRIDENASGYKNDYQFTGKERDDETSLLYYESRYYDSAIGRFTGIDPWSGDLKDPQSLNKYTYVRNNPVKYVDPSGNIFVLAAAPAIPAISASVVSLSLTTIALGITVSQNVETTIKTVFPASLGQNKVAESPVELQIGIGNTALNQKVDDSMKSSLDLDRGGSIGISNTTVNNGEKAEGKPFQTMGRFESGAKSGRETEAQKRSGERNIQKRQNNKKTPPKSPKATKQKQKDKKAKKS